MTDHFLASYIVSLFSESTSVTVKQLQLIGSGKRTPSVLFNVEKNKLYVLFALFPEATLEEWEQITGYLVNEKLLRTDGEQLSLTEEGSKLKSDVINRYHFSNNLDQLRYSATKKVFWRRFIFVTQIFSEYSYQNKQYIPYLSSLEDQTSVKAWLSSQGKPMDRLAVLWYKEMKHALGTMPPDHADFIAGHFVGHAYSGSTSRQLRDSFALDSDHYTILIDQLSFLLGKMDPEDYPLIASLWTLSHRDCDEGLSRSARLSKKMLAKGIRLNEVAARRKLKPNTIKEHILECVLVDDWPDFRRYISHTHYRSVHALFESDQTLTYPEAKQRVEDLDFFSFRLIEIERIRQNG